MEGWDCIFSYTRKQAIEDGVLIEVPDELKERVGVKFPIVCTSAVYALIDQERVADEFFELLMAMALAIRTIDDKSDRVDFGFKRESLYALCHPDDDGVTPVITIMMVGED